MGKGGRFLQEEILSRMELPLLLKEIARPDFPSPACVSSSAIIGSIASALIEMSCGCTLDEPSCLDVHTYMEKSRKKCRKVREQLLYLAQQDIEVFKEYLAFNRLQQVREITRTETLSQIGWKFTIVPLDIAHNSCLLLEEVKGLINLAYRKIVCDLIISQRLLSVNMDNMFLVIEENMQEMHFSDQRIILDRLNLLKERRDRLNIVISQLWQDRKNKELIHK